MGQQNDVSILDEVPADDELQMQELLKDTPDLLPVDDFEVTGPLMVVGRETTLASGAIDLVLLAPTGELVVVEFKTGPQNSDFRSAVAQLLDYGAALWGLSYDEFEAAVARRYFQSGHCKSPSLRGRQTIQEAASAFWGDGETFDSGSLVESLSQHLEQGDFHYVLVAQRFTDTMRRTLEYMNALGSARFFGVELVRFRSAVASAFESRTVLRPSVRVRTKQGVIDGGAFLERVADPTYRQALEELFDTCRGLGLRFEWGIQGTSIRIPVPDRTEPLSVAWVFPPGVSGWMGLKDVTLGYDTGSAKGTPSVQPALDRYLVKVQQLTGVPAIAAKAIRGYRISPEQLVTLQAEVAEILAGLARDVGGL